MTKKLSATERQRRFKQSQAQWEKDNPVIAHAVRNFKFPEKVLGSIQNIVIANVIRNNHGTLHSQTLQQRRTPNN